MASEMEFYVELLEAVREDLRQKILKDGTKGMEFERLISLYGQISFVEDGLVASLHEVKDA